MTVTIIPPEDPQAVRARAGVRLNEPRRRRPAGFRQVGAGFGAQEEAEIRERRARAGKER